MKENRHKVWFEFSSLAPHTSQVFSKGCMNCQNKTHPPITFPTHIFYTYPKAQKGARSP